MKNSKIDDISILIAEDEKQLLEPMVEYLQLFFSNVFWARDGLIAYEKYLKYKPDIVIADIHMPRLDGLSLSKKIRENDKSTRIIIATAHSEQEKLLEAIELNLVKYLIKPVKSDDLKNLLLSLVDELRQGNNYLYFSKDLYWDLKRKKLFQDKKEISLKPREIITLDLLCSNANQTVSSIDIFNYIFCDQPERDFSSDSITSLIKRLRQKLPKDIIRTSYGAGYILEVKNK